jgi:hypothetical protein
MCTAVQITWQHIPEDKNVPLLKHMTSKLCWALSKIWTVIFQFNVGVSLPVSEFEQNKFVSKYTRLFNCEIHN